VNGGSSSNVVGFQCLVIRQLLSGVDQADLVYLDPLLFLQGLLDGQDLVVWLKIEGLLTSCQRLDEDLETNKENIVEAMSDQCKQRCQG
jgi:hypothetical protein